MSSARSSRLSADRVAGGIFVVLALFAPLIFSEYWVATLLTQMLFLGIVAASLIFLSAYGGMVSLAQVSLYGVAGFALGNLTTNGNTKGMNLGWAEAPGIIVALVVAVFVAFVFGALASRSYGIYFLMITLVFSVIANLFFGQVTSVSGFGGISGIPIPDFLSRTAHPDRLYFVTLAVALLVYALLRYVSRTPFGLTLQGIRDDPVRMSSLGYNVALHRTLAFAFAGFIAAIGGDPLRLVERADRAVDDRPQRDHRRAGDRGHRRPLSPRGRLAGGAGLRAHQQLRAGRRPRLGALPHADRRHLPGHRPRVAQRPHRAVGAHHGGAAAGAAAGHHPGKGVGRAHTRRLTKYPFRGGDTSMPVARHPGRGAFWLAVTIAILAFAIAGCGSSNDNTTSGSSSTAAKSTSTAAPAAAPADAPAPQPAVAPRSGGSGTPIKVAVMSECKGAFGSFDNQNMSGVVAAMSQFAGAKPKNPNKPRDGFTGGAINGHPIKLVGVGCGDDTSDLAIKETRRLMEQLDADIMIGPLSGDESIAIANYAKQHPDKTFVDGSAGAQDTTLKVRAPNFFRFNGDGAQWNAGLGDLAYNKLGWRKAAIVSDDYSFGWTSTAPASSPSSARWAARSPSGSSRR